MKRSLAVLLAALALPAAGAAQPRHTPPASPIPPAAPLVTSGTLKPLKARAIGPAIMGGRISDIAFDPSDPHTFYVALATGGLMKTTDEGGTFTAVFDHQEVASTGAVAVAASNSKIVWLGTGESND